MENIQALRDAVRDIPDFPKPGIIFKDITPLLLDPSHFRQIIALLVREARSLGVNKVAGIDARGFLFGATVAHELGLGFVPIRKKGKLPHQTVSQSYALEYGEAEIEVHLDAFSSGERVVLIDDLLATGGTAGAAIALIHKTGATVAQAQFVLELTFLHGRAAIQPTPVFSLLQY